MYWHAGGRAYRGRVGDTNAQRCTGDAAAQRHGRNRCTEAQTGTQVAQTPRTHAHAHAHTHVLTQRHADTTCTLAEGDFRVTPSAYTPSPCASDSLWTTLRPYG